MKRAWIALAAALLLASAGAARAAIKSEAVTYKAGQVEAHSVLFYDDSRGGKRAGVLVVPEWWGLNDYAKTRAKMLARLGYVAMAVDIYGGGSNTADPKQARAWSSGLTAGDCGELRARIAAALQKLKSEPRVDPRKVAAIGYCFGGTTVLELARSGAGLNGVVSFHGGLDASNPAKPGEIKARILVCQGADDPFAPPAKVQAFEEEMNKAKADWEINIYSGAEHGFTNPANAHSRLPGIAYKKQADLRSWRAMRDFFKEIFK
ncbi:MAG TPA: dienelactone hydrolase family protein [Candidatus Binataceae bacterium]|nr:dienelactone hydrolase family protein [Candidatus Binataceae bacterium]